MYLSIICGVFFCLFSSAGASEVELWMEEFFHGYFFEKHALYTLLGTKPVTIIDIDTSPPEEYRKNQRLVVLRLPETVHYKALQQIEKEDGEYTLYKSYKRWKQWKDTHTLPQYRFRSFSLNSPHYVSECIGNVKEMAWTLEQHHSLFQKRTGIDFTPIEAAKDFGNESSPFWKKVFADHYLLGIILGFGQKNAYLFSLQEAHPELFPKKPFTQCCPLKEKELPLPLFRSFSSHWKKDPVFQKYIEEKQDLEELLKTEDSTSLILKTLLRNSTRT